ncbi:hypothetical protein B7P43_G07888 [Cryptotermes secundus]|uniref:Odorant receptor n=1 Tax=Cryptotermes secundus TaxID=105785 RepID=A0A2J7QJC0_9NEOP|nr:hypothetical protein B7P43_G07888 [Cryptotermes secundus]
MHLVGLWNHHWQNKRSWRYFAYFGYALFMVFILTVHSVSVVLELCFSWGDFTSFANTAWYASNFGASVIKQLFILTQTERVQSVTMKLRGGILSSGLRWSTEQEEISRNTNRQARRLSIMYYTVAVTSVLCVILLGLRTSYRQLSGAVNSANADADANKTMQFQESGCLCKGKSPGRPPRVSEEQVARISAAFERSLRKSTNRASRELAIPQPTVWCVLTVRLHLKPYRLQLVQALTNNDKRKRMEFCDSMLEMMEDELIFSGEATFHLSGTVNRHNVRIWGTEHPHETVEREKDSPKVNVFCAVSQDKELPLKAWYPVDTQQPGNYLLMFIFQLIVVTVGPMVNIGTDTFLMSLMIHACGEFRVLKKSLRSLKQRAVQLQDEDTSIRRTTSSHDMSLSNLVRREERSIAALGASCALPLGETRTENELLKSKASLDSRIQKALVECIRHHQQIILYVSDLEDMFSSMMFIQFLSISLRICLMIFLITLTGDKGLAQLTYFQLLFVSFLQGLPFCWYGSELTYQNESVARVVFETPWLEASLHFRRLLMIVVIRAQTTLHLTGGKIYIMSLETFQAVSIFCFRCRWRRQSQSMKGTMWTGCIWLRIETSDRLL